MIIQNIKKITVFTFLFLALANVTHAQDSSVNEQAKLKATEDAQLKETLYKKYKKEVQAYDKKDFDTLFLDFFKKQRDASLTLTKEEFYTYTIKIAIYSEKLGLLYKDQKEESQRAKQEWFDKNYSDYLNSKK
jgi:hypothetical protein